MAPNSLFPSASHIIVYIHHFVFANLDLQCINFEVSQILSLVGKKEGQGGRRRERNEGGREGGGRKEKKK